MSPDYRHGGRGRSSSFGPGYGDRRCRLEQANGGEDVCGPRRRLAIEGYRSVEAEWERARSTEQRSERQDKAGIAKIKLPTVVRGAQGIFNRNRTDGSGDYERRQEWSWSVS